MRLFLTIILTLALLLASTSVLGALADADGCSEQCPGDAPDGHCPPLCHHCLCCISIGPFEGPVAALLLGVEIHQTPVSDSTGRPESPFPVDIFHVPKFLLA